MSGQTEQSPTNPQDYVSFSASTWGSSRAGDDDNNADTRETPPPDVVQHRGFGFLSEESTEILVKALYMSLFAILGAFLRIVVAQLFGEECANPGTVGWLKAGSPLCVTADGNAGRLGGIVFAVSLGPLKGATLVNKSVLFDSVTLSERPSFGATGQHWHEGAYSVASLSLSFLSFCLLNTHSFVAHTHPYSSRTSATL